MPTALFELAIIFLLICVNGFFAMSELAIVSARRGRLQQMIEDGVQGAKTALALSEDPSRFLSTVQAGITLIGIFAGTYSGATMAGYLKEWLVTIPALAPLAETIAIGAVVVGIAFLSLVFGELVPKQIALVYPEPIACWAARPMRVIAAAAAPMVWFLGATTRSLLRLIGVNPERATGVTEEEVKSMIAEGTQAGVFEAAERDMIHSVLRLADRPVRAIMTPRVDVVWLDTGDPIDVIRDKIADSGHSRFPVTRGSIEAIEGVVECKNLLDRLVRGEQFSLTADIKQPMFVHDGVPVLKLMELFRTVPTKMVFIVDEYGSFEGIVTPTDILSAITGTFADEAEEETAIVRRDDGSWLIDGMTSIDEVERTLERRGMATDDDYHTLAGFVLWQLGHLPEIGERFRWRDWEFEVVDMDGRRIDRVMITQVDADAGDNDS